MKNMLMSVVLTCLVAIPSLAQSQRNGFQQGKIISIQEVPAAAGNTIPPAPLEASVSRYDVSAQVGDKVYVYRFLSESGEGVPWGPGQSQQVRIADKVMQVKLPNGEVEHYRILRSYKAGNQ
jgi:hypothetical protein